MTEHVPHIDEQLLHRLRNGEQTAFTRVYDAYKLPIYRKLVKLVRVETIAEELTQDVFVRLWDKRHLVDPQQPIKAYLYRIARHILYDFYRRVAIDERLQQEVRALCIAGYNHTEEDLFLKETQELLDQAIGRLSQQQRQVFTLCRLEGKTYAEVSQLLGISVHTISTHMTRASNSIKEYMLKYNHLVLISSLTTLAVGNKYF